MFQTIWKCGDWCCIQGSVDHHLQLRIVPITWETKWDVKIGETKDYLARKTYCHIIWRWVRSEEQVTSVWRNHNKYKRSNPPGHYWLHSVLGVNGALWKFCYTSIKYFHSDGSIDQTTIHTIHSPIIVLWVWSLEISITKLIS